MGWAGLPYESACPMTYLCHAYRTQQASKTMRLQPIVSNRPTTYKDLGLVLGVSAQTAGKRYRAILKEKGKVTTADLINPKVSVQTLEAAFQNTTDNLLARETEEILRLARLHGPTHASMLLDMPVETVRSVLQSNK